MACLLRRRGMDWLFASDLCFLFFFLGSSRPPEQFRFLSCNHKQEEQQTGSMSCYAALCRDSLSSTRTLTLQQASNGISPPLQNERTKKYQAPWRTALCCGFDSVRFFFSCPRAQACATDRIESNRAGIQRSNPSIMLLCIESSKIEDSSIKQQLQLKMSCM